MGQGQSINIPSAITNAIVPNPAPEKPKTTSPITTPPTPTKYQLTDYLHTIDFADCSTISIDTKCESSSNEQNCEVCKNLAYRDWYNKYNDRNIPFLANFSDSKAEYNRTWVQTCNLGIGIFVLSIGIYYQQS
jgi:hypothetical protein